ncbi:MAG: hypothetical protein AB7I36_17980 [Rhodospirillaceae bacterium]
MKRMKNTTLPVRVPADPGDDQTFAGIDPNRLYTTATGADAIGQKPSFLEARRAKDLPPKFLKLGRSVKYVGRDLISFLKAGYQGGDHE